MGMIARVLGGPGAVTALGQAARGVAEVFTPNATRGLELSHESGQAALAQYGAEFVQAPQGWFDHLVNGLNRLPRPMLALGTLGLFVYAMAEPEGFGRRMVGLALVPEPAHGQSRPQDHIGRMKHDTDILIVGGGLNGPALALALAQCGLRVVVVDARPAPARAEAGFDGRAYALAIASRRLLDGIGVWPRVAEKAQPILQIKASDGRAGEGPAPFFLTFDAAEIEEGPMGFLLEDRHLYAAFLAAMAAEPNITLLSGETVVGQTTSASGAIVALASGGQVSARLIVGCDGRTSGTASRAGIGRTGWGYGQTALVTAIRHEQPHNGIAHQFFMPSGPLAILPLAGGYHSSIVWSETDATAAEIQALDDAAYLEVLRPRFGSFLGDITLAGARFTYPLSLTLANSYVAPRVALVGDAAHGVHPIAGQGLNLGLRDVGALAQVLVDAARRGEDIGASDVLARYQEWRRFDATALALGMDAVNKLFSRDRFPVDQLVQEVGQIGRALVAEVDVIGMCSHTSQPSSAVWPKHSGFTPFSVLVTFSAPSLSLTSQHQPDPNWPAPAAAKSSLNFWTEPKLSVSAFSSAPGIFLPSPGPIISQNWLWFQCWLALLKMPFCATAPA
jgi:2-octaprenyl-6-methoxyphenol hydroxylase